MSWVLLVGVTSALGLSLLVAVSRRAELARMERSVRARERAVRQGGAKAELRHPVVDLSRCLGCATCIAVCPERIDVRRAALAEGLLDLRQRGDAAGDWRPEGDDLLRRFHELEEELLRWVELVRS